MASRVFVDADGRQWTAWETIPTRQEMVSGPMSGGWVTFMCGEDRYRYTPLPEGWADWPEHRLRAMLQVALRGPRR